MRQQPGRDQSTRDAEFEELVDLVAGMKDELAELREARTVEISASPIEPKQWTPCSREEEEMYGRLTELH